MNKKKLLLAVLCAFVALPTCAQYMGPHPFLATKKSSHATPQDNSLKRSVTKTVIDVILGHRYVTLEVCQNGKSGRQVKKQDWQSLVKSEERHIHRNGPLGTSFYALTTPSFKQQPVTAQDQEVYQQRLMRLESALRANTTLQNYTLAVPNPADLVTLGNHSITWTFEKLLSWLSNPSSPKQMECAKQVPGVVGISFTELTTRQVAFNLWIDARTKTVYLLNNGQYYGEK